MKKTHIPGPESAADLLLPPKKESSPDGSTSFELGRIGGEVLVSHDSLCVPPSWVVSGSGIQDVSGYGTVQWSR